MKISEIEKDNEAEYFVVRQKTFAVAVMLWICQYLYVGFVLNIMDTIYQLLALISILFLIGSYQGKSVKEIMIDLKDSFMFKDKEKGFIGRNIVKVYRKIKGIPEEGK